MTALAGVWGTRPQQVSALLDAMGPRSASHRSTFAETADVAVACGHHAARAGQGVCIDGSLVLVLDGRLDDGAERAGRLDHQIIFEAYKTRGVAGFAQLKGQFALILWDGERRRLICARDALGARPLVYRQTDEGFAVCSEERGLAPLYGDEPLQPLRVAEFLAGRPPPIDAGMRASVRRVPPGEAVIVSNGVIKMERFDRLALPEATSDAPEDQIRRFAEILQTSVARHCAGEKTVDCFLSGGLDSSTLAMIASRAVTGPVRTLSLVDDSHPALSEKPYIDAVVEAGPFDVHLRYVAGYDPFAGAEDALRRHAGPVAAPNLLMMRPLYQDAREGALLLDGHGGDEVVSKGLGRLHDLARAGRWITLYAELRGVADLYGERASSMLWSLFRAYGPGRYKLAAVMSAARRLTRRRAAPRDDLDLLAEAFRTQSGIEEEIARRRRPRPSDGRTAEHAVLLEPQQVFALEVLDREAQDAGVEARCPFWDRRLIDYSMSLPPSAKLKGGWTRLILRQAMAGTLPPEVLWRRDKHDFSAQLRLGLQRSAILSPGAIEVARASLAPFVDVDRVLALRARLDDVRHPVSGADLQMLWRIGLWSIWLRLQNPRPVP